MLIEASITILAALIVLLLSAWAVRQVLFICGPTEALIFSGRKHITNTGRSVGFRLITAGRAIRIPVLERVDRMDTSNISVPMNVRGAYSEGGIPLSVQAIANVKISTKPQMLGNAVERFMGQSRNDVERVAKETLEGHLRGVLAMMTPEEVNEDRLKFAQRLADEASADLAKLGIQLDLLKVQAVSDDRNYLDSIGRSRIAEIVRTAEVAESDAQRTAEEAEASAKARAGVAVASAQAAAQQKASELRRIQAELESHAKAEEERAEQAALAARAEAEKDLQQVRAEVEQARLRADVQIPADMARQVAELKAAGEAAATRERGTATALALQSVAQAWQAQNGDAMDIVVAQQLQPIFERVGQAAAAVQASSVSVIDAGDGQAVAGYGKSYAATVGALLGELRDTLGVDVARVTGSTPNRG